MRHLLTMAGQPLRGDCVDAGDEELVLDLHFPGCTVRTVLLAVQPSAASATKSIAEITPTGRP